MTAPELAARELRVLVGEIDTAREVLGRLLDELRRSDPGPGAEPPRDRLALLAIDLHSWYTALESLLLRILAAFEGAPPAGDSSHALALRAALRDVEGVRPAILASAHRDDLDEIRRFRHFFRHAYALDLRHDKLRPALDAVLGRSGDIDGDLTRFADHVRRLIADLESRPNS